MPCPSHPHAATPCNGGPQSAAAALWAGPRESRRAFATLAAGLVIGALALLQGCAVIEFERGPNAVRGLDVVYSEQEDMTFFVWRLRDDAEYESLGFELYSQGRYVPIDLGQAPYAAAPWTCDRSYRCFQFQMRGRYTAPAGVAPVRSVHASLGIFEGPEPRFYLAAKTMGLDPIAVDQNRAVDPRRYDWFWEREVPLQRAYAWQRVGLRPGATSRDPAQACKPAQDGAWQPMGERLNIAAPWTDDPGCLAVRAQGQAYASPIVYARLVPSAALLAETQDYVPARLDHPTLYGFLFDLQVVSEARCQAIRAAITESLRKALGRTTGRHQEIGVYTPLDPETGLASSGCVQRARQDYPVARMQRDAQDLAAAWRREDVRVLWIYVNNASIPPGERLAEQMTQWRGATAPDSPLVPFFWAIASESVAGWQPWDHVTGWRPLEDRTLAEDLERFVDYHVPFASMAHDEQSRVPILPPERGPRPLQFKVCEASHAQGLVYLGEAARAWPTGALPWPPLEAQADGQPRFAVPLPPQRFVAKKEYVEHRVELVVESCSAFCDQPFRSASGEDFPNWQVFRECQWTP